MIMLLLLSHLLYLCCPVYFSYFKFFTGNINKAIFLNLQGRIQIENGALTISNLNLTDSGRYQCIAENKHGVIYSSAELRVVGKISFCH